MNVVEILKEIKSTSGSNDKKAILEAHKENKLLREVLKMGLDPFTPFHVVKVPKVEKRVVNPEEDIRWSSFIDAADMCATRFWTGNKAVQVLQLSLIHI